MNKWIALGAALLVLALLIYLYRELAGDAGPALPVGQQPPVEAAPDAPSPTESLRDPTHDLEPVAKLEPGAVPKATEQGPGATLDEASQAQAERSPPPMPETGHFDALRRAYEAETRDGLWAREQETLIPKLVTEAGFPKDALDGEVSCRRTLCRFSLRMLETDQFALMKLALRLQTEHGLSLAYGDAELVDEKTRIVVYSPRAGYSLEDVTKK